MALLGALGSGAAAGSDPDRALYELLTRMEPARTLRRLPGRESFGLATAEGPVVVKRYRAPGGWSALRRPGRVPAARVEGEALSRLQERGVAVPEPLWWGSGREGSVLVLRWVEHDERLRERLAAVDPGERRVLLDALLDLVVRLHRLGWHHKDLYLDHVLVERGSGRLVLIDLERARPLGIRRERWLVKDLAALASSAPACVTRAERRRFLGAWLSGTGRGEEDPRPWWRRVGAKARRQRAHRPRHVDPSSTGAGGAPEPEALG